MNNTTINDPALKTEIAYTLKPLQYLPFSVTRPDADACITKSKGHVTMSRFLPAHSYSLSFILLLILHLFVTNTQAASMPNVVGQSIEQAKQTLAAQEINITTIRKQKSNKADGEVIIQSPVGGKTVYQNTPVRLIVSEPIQQLQKTSVPNLKNLSLEAAKARLAEAQLKLGHVRKRNMEVESEYVLYQTPLPNEVRLAGSSVNITLSNPLPIQGSRVKIRFDKSRIRLNDTLELRAEILNPKTDMEPRYSFNIDGRVIPSESSSLTYQFKQTGKHIIIASARYGRQPWINSRSRAVYVGQTDVAEEKTSPATRKTTDTETKPSPSTAPIKPSKPSAGTHDETSEKWKNPKAGIYPNALTVSQGNLARFYSRSSATKRSNLDYQWKAAGQQGSERQFSIDTSQLITGKTYKVRLRIKDDRGLVDVATATVTILAEKKETNPPQAQAAEVKTITEDKSKNPQTLITDNDPQGESQTTPSTQQPATVHSNDNTSETLQTEQTIPTSLSQTVEPANDAIKQSRLNTAGIAANADEAILLSEAKQTTLATNDFLSTHSLDNKAQETLDKPLPTPKVSTIASQASANTPETSSLAAQEHLTIYLKSSSMQLLSGNRVKFNIEPISTVTRDDFELTVVHPEQQYRLTLPLINAEYSFATPGRYEATAKVMTANGIVTTNTLYIRVYSLWIPIIIVLSGGLFILIHLRLKRNRRRRWD